MWYILIIVILAPMLLWAYNSINAKPKYNIHQFRKGDLIRKHFSSEVYIVKNIDYTDNKLLVGSFNSQDEEIFSIEDVKYNKTEEKRRFLIEKEATFITDVITDVEEEEYCAVIVAVHHQYSNTMARVTFSNSSVDGYQVLLLVAEGLKPTKAVVLYRDPNMCTLELSSYGEKNILSYVDQKEIKVYGIKIILDRKQGESFEDNLQREFYNYN